MMITVVHFPRAFGIPNPSPFCMKVEILLQMAGLPYDERIETNPRKGPKGKIPFIIDEGLTIGDSAFIQHHLERKYGTDFDKGLSTEQRAIAHGLSRMAEERLYWCMVYSRWMDDANWPKIRKFFFGDLPPVIRSIVPAIARKGVRAGLNGHGIGRHSRAEIYELGSRDLEAIAVQLGDKPYLMGGEPTSLDACIYPLIDGMLIEEMPSPLLDTIKRHPNLVAYRDRCRARWFAHI